MYRKAHGLIVSPRFERILREVEVVSRGPDALDSRRFAPLLRVVLARGPQGPSAPGRVDGKLDRRHPKALQKSTSRVDGIVVLDAHRSGARQDCRV